jgi:hypothetical protein
MAEHNTIGEAFVGIRPDTAGFEQQLLKAVSTALGQLKSLHPELPGLGPAVQQTVQAALANVRWDAAAGRFRSAMGGQFTSLGREVDAALEPAVGRAREAAKLIATLPRTSAGQVGFGSRTVGFTGQPRLFVPNELTQQLEAALERPVAGWGRLVKHTLIDEAFKPAEEQLPNALGAATRKGLGSLPGMMVAAADQFGADLRTAAAPLRPLLVGAANAFGSAVRGAVSGIGGLVASSIGAASGAIRSTLHSAITGGMQVAGLASGVLLAAGITQGVKGIQLGAALAQSRAIFDELTGSVEKSASTIKALQDVAIDTGNAFQPLADGAKQMLAVGLASETITPALQSAAKFATVFGSGASNELPRVTLALEQMGLKGRAMAEELRQLVNAGIPAYAILTKAAQLSGIAIDSNTAGFADNQAAVDSVRKATLSLQGAQQHQAAALKSGGAGSLQYADATRSVERAQINLTAAQKRLADSTAKVSTGTAAAMKAMKEGKISADAYLKAMSDPEILGLAEGAILAMQGNLLFQTRVLKSIFSVSLGKFFEPIQNVIALPLAGITSQLAILAKSDAFAKLGQQIADHVPTVPLTNLANAVSDLIQKFDSFDLDKITGRFAGLAPVLGAAAGAAAAMALSFGSGLPLIGALFIRINPLLGALIGMALFIPRVRDAIADMARGLGRDLFAALRVLQPLLAPLVLWLGRVAEGAKPLVAALGRDLVLAARAVEPFLKRLIDWLGSGIVAGERNATRALQSLGDGLGRVGGFLQIVSDFTGRLADRLGGALGEAFTILQPSLAAFASTSLPAVLQLAADALDRLLPFLIVLGAAVLRDIVDKLGPLVGALARFLDLTLQLVPASGDMNAQLAIMVPLVEALALAWAAVKVGGFLGSLRALGPIVGPAARLLGGLAIDLGGVVAASAGLEGILGVSAAGVGLFAVAAALVMVGIHVFFLTDAWNKLVKAWNDPTVARGVAWVGEQFSALGSLVSGTVLPAIGEALVSIATDPAHAIGFVLGFVVGQLLQLPERAGQVLGLVGGLIGRWLSDTGVQAIALWNLILHPPDPGATVGSWFSALGAAVVSFNWSQLGLNIWDGILNGITFGMYGAIRGGALQSLWNGLVEGFHAAGIGRSPYRLFEPVGGNVIGGVMAGMFGAQADAVRAAGRLISDLAGADVALGAGLPRLAPVAAAAAGGSSASGPPIYLTVHVTNPGASADEIGEAIGWKLSRAGVVRR